MTLRIADFDFDLPPHLIAQQPAEVRERSRLMVVDRASGRIEHRIFTGITEYLHPGDTVVVNRSRVIPARLACTKPTGGAVELLLLREIDRGRWLALGRPSKRLRAGAELVIAAADTSCRLEEARDGGQWVVRFDEDIDVHHLLSIAGSVPLPRYIRNPNAPLDRYQTVYADRDGSVAAPTAGLHFSEGLLAALGASGVRVERVTLHVGLGTFRPVTADLVQNHQLHAEWGEVPAGVARELNRVREAGGRIVVVGTTTTRLLESAADSGGTLLPFAGETDKYIFPGYRFRCVDSLVTNFHLPRSSLLLLVSAFAGRELVLHAYHEAIAREYRFYSFGDAMLIL